MNFRTHAIAVAAGLLCAGSPAWTATEVSGKRIDNGRIDLFSVPPPAEVQPAIAYPMPSGVSREEAAGMRARATQTPPSPAAVNKALEEAGGLSLFVSGKAELTPSARAAIESLATEIRSKGAASAGMRIAVVGHTDNQRLAPDTKRIFKDNQGLSEARALAVTAYLKQLLNNPTITYSIQGEGESKPLASNATPEGMARNRRVELRVWFQPAAVAVPAAPPAAALPPCTPQSVGQSTVPFRITIDGEPINTAEIPNEADGQRCADVALERADIQVRYDSLAAVPLMNAWATPGTAVRSADSGTNRGRPRYLARSVART